MPEVLFKTDGLAGFKDRVLEHARALDRKQSLPSESIVSFASIHEMLRVLTPRRVELLERLTHNGGQPINLLAKQVHRKRDSVLRDLGVLRKIGAINTGFVDTQGNGRVFVANPVASKYEFVCSITRITSSKKQKGFAGK